MSGRGQRVAVGRLGSLRCAGSRLPLADGSLNLSWGVVSTRGRDVRVTCVCATCACVRVCVTHCGVLTLMLFPSPRTAVRGMLSRSRSLSRSRVCPVCARERESMVPANRRSPCSPGRRSGGFRMTRPRARVRRDNAGSLLTVHCSLFTVHCTLPSSALSAGGSPKHAVFPRTAVRGLDGGDRALGHAVSLTRTRTTRRLSASVTSIRRPATSTDSPTSGMRSSCLRTSPPIESKSSSSGRS